MTTTDKILSSNARGRIRSFLNTLALKPVKRARVARCCQLCGLPIEPGVELRDGGPTRRAHEFCFQAVNRDFRGR